MIRPFWPSLRNGRAKRPSTHIWPLLIFRTSCPPSGVFRETGRRHSVQTGLKVDAGHA
jgi:hypothetical protein